MLHVRTATTASGATAVQVIRYHLRKRVVVKHIGSAHTKEDIISLKKIAIRWIEQESQQQALFPLEKKGIPLPLVSIDKLRNLGFRYTFAYEVLNKLLCMFNLSDKEHRLLLDLVLIRIMQPASKLESFALLSELFGIHHDRRDFYRLLPAIAEMKEAIETNVIAIASRHFSFDFHIVFYDVTTLYFESFTQDEDKLDDEGNIIERGMKKNGYSKDLKFNQPQIVIGLIVNTEGFPISYEIFEGNTFEGDTFIPVITDFKKKHKVESLTVVADAAMISFDNIEKLKGNSLSYIVGGRIANLKRNEMREVSMALIGQTEGEEELQKKDGISTRIETDRGLLVCDFSFKRYQKDKREMEKQIAKAKLQLEKKLPVKRIKFLKNRDKKKTKQILNTDLIEKTKMLLGMKGYYTNLSGTEDKTIIDQYHNLWQVEKAFRIAKSDLQTRPIYHFKRQTIEAHILICFMALVTCKYMELKTKKSTKVIIKLLRQVTDARILHTLTNEEIILRSEISTETEEILKMLSLPH
jgi:transposase